MSSVCSPLTASTYWAVVQSLPHGVLLLDPTLRVLLANRAASVLFGAPPLRLRGAPVASILPITNLHALLRDVGMRRTRVLETTLTVAQDHIVTLRIKVVRLSAEHEPDAPMLPGDPLPQRQEFRLLILEDISDKATLEQQLVETEKQAAVGQLAAGILHEVNNPLASLGSNLLFVRGVVGASHPAVAQALDVSLEQLHQMRELLGTLSGVPRRGAPRYERADLHEIIHRCLTFIAQEADRRHIHLSASLAPDVRTCEVDVRLIKQVLLNLLKNAMEAMPDGGILDVRTSLRRDGADGSMVTIEVADTGIGIDEGDLRKVFRPLYSTKPRGAGLGLSFCRQTVEEHGGEIRLKRRTPDAGTMAVLTLPVHQPANGDE